MKYIIALITITMIGCHSYSSITVPSGKSGAILKCEVLASCYKDALVVCKNGFDVLNASSSFDIWAFTGVSNTLLVECK
jgi:hypothetical protein